MALTIKELLEAMNASNIPNEKGLSNTREVWEAIGYKDSLEKYGVPDSEKESTIKEFISENDYNNIN